MSTCPFHASYLSKVLCKTFYKKKNNLILEFLRKTCMNVTPSQALLKIAVPLELVVAANVFMRNFLLDAVIAAK